MTITDVLLNFRQALLGVLPAVQRVEIPWQMPDSYDEWDAIASALFNVLVAEVLRWSLPTSLQQKFRIPKYDLLLESHDGMCVVEVEHPSLQQGRYVFHSFGTDVTPFDVVEVLPVSSEGNPCGDELMLCPVSGVSFRLQLAPSLGGEHQVEEIVILE